MRWWAAWWYGLALLAGCRPGQPELAPVHGRVWFQGRPLPGGTIVFTPDARRGGRGPLGFAEVGPDGTFSVSTGTQKGAAVGWHRITLAPARQPDGQLLTPHLPRRLCDPELSGQSFEVKPSQSNHCELRLD